MKDDAYLKHRADELADKFQKEDAGQPEGKMPDEPERCARDEDPSESKEDAKEDDVDNVEDR